MMILSRRVCTGRESRLGDEEGLVDEAPIILGKDMPDHIFKLIVALLHALREVD